MQSSACTASRERGRCSNSRENHRLFICRDRSGVRPFAHRNARLDAGVDVAFFVLVTYTADQLRQINDALAAGKPVPAFAEPPARSNEESRNQIALVDWWRSVCVVYGLPEISLMAFPLQGARTARNGARMKREGCRKGTPDMLLAVPRGKEHGLWIENKSKGGYASKEQKEALNFLFTQGYATAIAYDLKQAQAVITEYLK